MFNSKTKNGGFSLIELIFVMALVAIFGVTTFTLVASGSSAYRNIIKKKDANSELRVALSYINMRVRQNDSEGSILIKGSPSGYGNAVVVSEKIDMATYETWIFWDSGRLWEAYIEEGEPVEIDKSSPIAELDGIAINYEEASRTISLAAWKTEKGIRKDQSLLIHLRSGK